MTDPAHRQKRDAELRALDIDPDRLRAFAPDLAAAVERLGLRAAVDRRLPYVVNSPRLRRDLGRSACEGAR